MTSSHQRISRITALIALILAMIVTVGLPLVYFALKYQNIEGKLNAEAEINARLVSRLIVENPDLWRFETHRLDELLSRRPAKGNPEVRRISELNGSVVSENGAALPWPVIRHDEQVMDGGRSIAIMSISTTLRPLLIETLAMLLVGLSLGGGLFVALRVLPFRAILRAEQALIESNEFLARIMENDTNGIIVIDTSEKILLVNQALESFCGRSRADLHALVSYAELFSEVERDEIRARIESLFLGSAQNVRFEQTILREDGSSRHVSCGAAPILKNDDVEAVVISMEDITDRKESEERIRQMSYFDSLTQLPNRALFSSELERSISYARRYNSSFGLMLIDIDNFKRINDTLGHAYGDELLKQVAERLVSSVRKSDYLSRALTEGGSEVVARLGGDEFIILLTSFKHEEDAARVANRIIDRASHPYLIKGQEIFATLSIGIATYPGDGVSQDVLFRNADTAMYHAKFLGKNTYQFYRASMNESAMQRLTMENHLFRALDQQEFCLNYQPKVHIATGDIVGVEALLRWRNPELGQVSPLDFIPLAEENGLIIPITEWVLGEACRQARVWQDAGLPLISVAVNISTQVLKQRNLPEMIRVALEQSQLEPGQLEVEITESIMLHDVAGTIELLKQVRDMGVVISIDDFGTGYSSFSYLKQLPVHALKIDRSFVKDLPENVEDSAIVKAIIATSHSLNLKVVAEGVETTQQREFLSWNNCDEFQGYLFSKPLVADGIAELLRKSAA